MCFPDGYLLSLELWNNPIEILWLVGGLILMDAFTKCLDNIEKKNGG